MDLPVWNDGRYRRRHGPSVSTRRSSRSQSSSRSSIERSGASGCRWISTHGPHWRRSGSVCSSTQLITTREAHMQPEPELTFVMEEKRGTIDVFTTWLPRIALVLAFVLIGYTKFNNDPR